MKSTMSSYDFERSDENTPLIKNNTINSNINYTSKERETSNFEDSGSFQNSSCYNNDLTSSDGNNNSNNVEESGAANQKIKIYAKRWYILAVFSVLGILQGLVWNTFGPISSSLLSVFCGYWDEGTIALLGNWGNIMYIIPVIPVLWYFEVYGLRRSMILTGGMMLLGTALRCLPGISVGSFTWLSHICAILNGMAGIVIFSAPSAVSSAWFPPGERTTATGIAIVFNNLGNAVSFLLAPAIVPDPPENRTSTTSNMYIVDNDTELCPGVLNEERTLIHQRLDLLMYLEAGMVAFIFACIFFHFPSKPKHPPSITSTMERTSFLPSLYNICTNRQALLMTFSFAFFNGLIASWFCVMDITFKHLPIADPEDMDKTIGHIGLLAICGNSVSCIVVSAIVDKLKGKMKRTLLIIMVCGISCWIWLGLICLEAIPFHIGSLYCATILASGITYSSGPIFFEFTVELVYPVPEGVVGGFLTVVYNTTGMIFLFLFNIPALHNSTHWIPYAFMASTAISLPMLLLVKEEYRRSNLDTSWNDEPRQEERNENNTVTDLVTMNNSCNT